MRKILTIAACEFGEMIKTKTFLISVLITPVIMIGIMFFTTRLMKRPAGPRPPLVIGVTDSSGQVTEALKKQFDDYNRSNPSRQIVYRAVEDGGQAEEAGKTQLRSNTIHGYILMDESVFSGGGKVRLFTYKPKPSDTDIFFTAENMIRGVVIDQRCRTQNIDPKVLNQIRSVPIERIEVGETADNQKVQNEANMVTRMMIPFFFMFMIYMGIMISGQHILSSIIEEKSSRIIEMMLSAVSPFEMMAGKILGLSGIGLAVMGLWAGTAYGTAQWQGLTVDVRGMIGVYLLIYYILGFVLFGAVMAGIGSICNTLKESQSLMMPMVMLCILPMISWFNLVQSPNGLFARVLSFIPPVTPLVMVLRLSATTDVPMMDVVLSVALLGVSVLAAIWAAGKIFKTGILMYGKRPSLREVFYWLLRR
jgi:ABC-2 type transport system permease protein